MHHPSPQLSRMLSPVVPIHYPACILQPRTPATRRASLGSSVRVLRSAPHAPPCPFAPVGWGRFSLISHILCLHGARAHVQERMDKLWGDCTHAGDDAQAPSTPVRNKVIGEFELERLSQEPGACCVVSEWRSSMRGGGRGAGIATCLVRRFCD